jgi:hypothetical protein
MTRARKPEAVLLQIAELRRTAQVAAALVAGIDRPDPAGVVEFGPQVMAFRDLLDLKAVEPGWLPAYARSARYWYLHLAGEEPSSFGEGIALPPSPATVIDPSGLLWRLSTHPERHHRSLSLWSLDAVHDEAGRVARRFVELLRDAVDRVAVTESEAVRAASER